VPRRILYVNQISQVSGAERSLLELLDGLPPNVAAAVACPEGDLATAVRSRDVPVVTMPEIALSFRLHPLHTTKGLGSLAHAAFRLRASSRRLDSALVHANSTRAGLAAALAARMGGAPTIVHVRDWVPDGRLGTAPLRAIDLGADAVVANSRYVAAQQPERRRSLLRVIYDPVDTASLDPDRIDRDGARARLGLDGEDIVMAVVAHLTPWKGQDDAIRVLARLRPLHPRLRLVLAGSAKFTAPGARFDSRAYERDLRAMVRKLGLERQALFLGERNDVPEILRAADLLLVPSWREAFGRVAVEGMAMRLPVVATGEGGPAEIVRDGVDGLVLPPRDPDRWAEAVGELLAGPELRAEMGRRGRERATREFTVERHVAALTALYDELLHPGRGG
jgi:glycosyltransferase involved in cell wall biosynthesis